MTRPSVVLLSLLAMVQTPIDVLRRSGVATRASVVLAGCVLVAGCGGAGQPPADHSRGATGAVGRAPAERRAPSLAREAPARPPDPGRMLGQMIVARFQGAQPSATFLTRIRKGQVGGVILFADNLAGGLGDARRLTGRLQQAAARGRNPPLLIMTDQEGGEVRRLPGPPSLAPAAMTSDQEARAQGEAAGRLLRSAGIDVDLAPVADVEPSPNFLGSRSFGGSPAVVAGRACAFAAGLSSAQVAYALKHFPGLGLAGGNTDLGSVSVEAPADQLRAGYGAYQACGSGPLGLVMVSSAAYPTLSGPLPAVMSPEIYRHELRLALPHGMPVTISDDLQSPAIEAHPAPARHAIQAGIDLLMYAQTEQASAAAYATLLSELRLGVVSEARVAAAARVIRALKERLAQ